MSSRFLFFQSTEYGPVESACTLPLDCRVEFWQPCINPLSGYVGRKLDLVWWLFHHAHVFGNRNFSVCRIWLNSQLVHQTTVFPPFFRFPFMAPNDLQIGDTWTLPSQRGRGFAGNAIKSVLAAFAGPDRLFWYVASEDNAASIRVIEKCAFRLIGTGVRTTRLGLRLLGDFRITEHSSSS